MDLSEKLRQIEEKNLTRKNYIIEKKTGRQIQIEGKRYICFSSNDYLGLTQHKKVIAEVKKVSDSMGYGSGSAHLICGHTSYHHQLQEFLCDFVGGQEGLLFANGYMANMAVQQTFLTRKDVVFHDRLNHASLLDGAVLSRAKLSRYTHLDNEDLVNRIRQSKSCKMIVSDGVFSMDGDRVNAKNLDTIAKKNNAWLVIDDAHAVGIIGDGKGSYAEAQILPNGHRIVVITFGKALASYGALIVADRLVVETLKQFARPYIYTTACPPANAAATLVTAKIIASDEGQELRSKLKKIGQKMQCALLNQGWKVIPSDTPIKAVVVGQTKHALHISEQLKQRGFWLSAIRPPTVPEGSSRLRIALSAEHTMRHIDKLITCLGELRGKYSYG